jgi:hypothetical protein
MPPQYASHPDPKKPTAHERAEGLTVGLGEDVPVGDGVLEGVTDAVTEGVGVED